MTTHCPPAEQLAEFAEGKLRSADALMLHVETCRHCRTTLTLLNQTIATDRKPARVYWFGGLAAAAALAAIFILWPARSRMRSLVELAPKSARTVEPRLSGGFAWAPYHGPMRGNAATDANRLKLAGAAGDVIEHAARDSSAEAQHAAGIAYVLIEQPSEAIERLRDAANRSPNDANAWSDLAAAQYTAALRLPNPALFPEGLASADRALRIDANRPEALFNRALILEHMGLAGPARAAWTRYLEVDATSKWAVEARAHLGAQPQASADTLFKNALPHTDGASLAKSWPEQSRAWGEAEFLGRWGEAFQRNDTAEADRSLAIARALGEGLRATTGEALLGDAVRAIDRGDAKTLAEAHALYRKGRMAYGQQHPSAAEPDLRRAALLFSRANSPMARMARYYAANTRFDQNDIPAARAELESLIADEHYAAAGALERWQLALCHFADGDGDAAVAPLTQAAETLARLGEQNNHGFVESLLADAFASTGRPVDAWAARIRSFDALSRAGRGDRLLANVASAVTAERRAGHRDNALALLEIEREVGREHNDPVLLTNTLARGAVLSAELDDLPRAAKLVDEAAAVASTITDPAFRAIDDANVALARGAASADPQLAAQHLRNALDAYRAMGQRALEVDCHLFLARNAEKLGDRTGAMREIDAGLDAFDGTTDSIDALVADAIRLSLDRGDTALAFGYAERSRQLANEVRSRLAGSGTAILELVVLPHETVSFTIDEHGIDAKRQRIPRDAVRELAKRCSDGDRDAAAALYDLLIPNARPYIIVADPLLADVPFAALRDRRSNRYLIEQAPIAMAESATSLQPATSQNKPAKAIAVSLDPALAESQSESTDVASAYAGGVRLPQATFASFVAAAHDADVIHISGHTANDDDSGRASLVFAREPVSWRAIAAQTFPHLGVAVLAACDTLRAPRFAGTRAPSLGGAFLTAGARDVIGTLRPIGDRDARELFRAIHRELAAGASASDAVRKVQLEAMAHEQSAWSSIAIFTRMIRRQS
jgi:predicted negative regulator of RcsB-dependent stress response